VDSKMEEWREVPGYPGYRASSLGRILGKSGREIGCFKAKYVVIGLGFGKSPITRHRMIALAFLGPPPFPGAEIDHINQNKHDDRPENLRWTDRFENMMNRQKLSHSLNNFKGVKYEPGRQSPKKWKAMIQHKKTRYSEYFLTEEEAVLWRNKKLEELVKK